MSRYVDENGLLIDEYGSVVSDSEIPLDAWAVRETMRDAPRQPESGEDKQ